jgi:hypothetical protein
VRLFKKNQIYVLITFKFFRAGTGVAQQEAVFGLHSSDIPGLACRVENPLKFLGLYDTTNSACRRK